MPVNEIVDGVLSNIDNDSGANYIALIENLNTIGRITEVILGLMVAIIVIGLPFVIAIEVIYMNFPFIQDKYEQALMSTEGKMKGLLGLVIRDARESVRIASMGDGGQTVNRIYLGRKMKTIILSVVTVGLVLTGGTAITQLIVNIANSILSGIRMVI